MFDSDQFDQIIYLGDPPKNLRGILGRRESENTHLSGRDYVYQYIFMTSSDIANDYKRDDAFQINGETHRLMRVVFDVNNMAKMVFMGSD